MKILACGDSWTEGYEVDKPWCGYLSDHEVSNLGVCGGANEDITRYCLAQIDNFKPDLIIIGWSNISRKTHNYPNQFSLSYVPDEDIPERKAFFQTHDLDWFQQKWYNEISQINALDIPSIHFSVFGDHPLHTTDIIEESFLGFLAKQMNINWEYDIPMFEFDYLSEGNHVTEDFAKRNFDSNWERACVEREDIRSQECLNRVDNLFLPCGHPNETGHKLWGEYIQTHISNFDI